MKAALTILAPGASATIQDLGRTGYKRFGVPPGGAMDAESARMANRLAGADESAPVIEVLFGGLRLRAEERVTLAVTGARTAARQPLWRSFEIPPGEEFDLGYATEGLWIYVAAAGGIEAPQFFGSASVNARAGLGRSLQAGDRLALGPHEPSPVAGRFVPEKDRPDFGAIPTLTLYPGPEWDAFPAAIRDRFLGTEWTISSQSDRSGFRLDGPSLAHALPEILSAPTAVGTVQLPSSGQPIVLMRDGPTVGGYPRLGLLDPAQISRFAQCAPGRTVRFILAA